MTMKTDGVDGGTAANGTPQTNGQFPIPKPAIALAFTGERMTSAREGQVAIEHYHRYCLARDLVAGLDVLDVAAGEGYGSAMMAPVARSVVGVEIDPDSVRHARAAYALDNLRFIEGNATKLPLADACVDAVVSFETLEHLHDQQAFMQEVRRVLRPGGFFIVSTPDRLVYSAPGQTPNPHHVLELTATELATLLGQHFRHHHILAQRAIVGSVLARADGGDAGWRTYESSGSDLIKAQQGLARAMYLVALAGDGDLPSAGSSLFVHETTVDDFFGQRHGRVEAERRAAQAEAKAHEAEAAAVTAEAALHHARNAEAELKRQYARRQQQLDSAVRETARLRDVLDDANRHLASIQQSRSWRMTRPYRAAGRALKDTLLAAPKTGILQRTVVGTLLLPSAAAYHGGVVGALRAFRPRSGFLAGLIEDQEVLRERLLQRPRIFRLPAFVGFSLATHVLQSGSVTGAARELARVFRQEGTSGLRSRLLAGVPGLSSIAPRAHEATLPSRQPASVVPKEAARRILVADYRIPRGDVSAGEHATVGILKDLRRLGYEVVFLPGDMAPSPHYAAGLRALELEVVTPDTGYASARDYVAANAAQFGALYVIRVNVAELIVPLFRQLAPAARVIFHAPDLQYLRELREAELRHDPAMRQLALVTRDRELAAMRLADEVVVVSPSEVPFLQADLTDVPVSVFPVLYTPSVPREQGFAERRHFFFLGGFTHTPNVDAVQWFVAEIWPLVRNALPDAEFHILGAEAPPSIIALGQLPGIRFVGFVQNLDPLLGVYRLAIAPLRYGAGIKGKVAIALGAGIPCVCTTIAAEGMGIEDGVQSLVADDPRGFADALVALYRNAALWDRLSRSGQALVRERFSDEANRAALLQVLDKARVLPLSLFAEYCRDAPPEPLPSPGTDETVDVSIIIPVYNKWTLTHACLTSVVQTSIGSGVRYEVILADDGSSDDTREAATIFSGLRVVRPPTNLGFLRNCNHAAKHARGRYLLLLNNDTVVLPGWLSALYRTMEADISAAIVGSKLLYPDGIIQEAGAALFADGTGCSVGRGHSRDTEVFNIRREVDYISGASILIRASFWADVGGFDERYMQAYCEDSDLAMTARAKGMRVVYEPRSELVHFEHGSYAEQGLADSSALQKHNTRLLLEKWKDIFETRHSPPAEWQVAASCAERSVPATAAERRRSGRLNILYFSPFPSHPASHGNRATIQSFARRFQDLGHAVHFVLLHGDGYAASDVADMRAAWETLDILENQNSLHMDPDGVPFDGWYGPGLGERIRVLCAKYDIDLVFCSYIFQSKLLDFVPNHMLKVIDTHDKMGDRYEMLRRNGQPLEFFSCTPEEEGAYLRRADIVVARRQEEARYFDSVSGRNTAIVIPHIEMPHFTTKQFTALSRVGVVASANRINLAILLEFLRSLDRQLAGSPCPFTVHIAGEVKDMVSTLSREDAAVFSAPWVRLRGFVPDIANFYGEMDAVVSPVTMGTGINVKTVQAMAYGMPLLTTAFGSKGIETTEPMHNFPNLDALAARLLQLSGTPGELVRLAEVSRERYQRFLDDSAEAIREMFRHPKLLPPASGD